MTKKLTFSEFIKTDYESAQSMFEAASKLFEGGVTLKNVHVGQYIKKISRMDNCFELLRLLTYENLISLKQFGPLWNKLVAESSEDDDIEGKNFVWVDQLMNNNFEFTEGILEEMKMFMPRERVNLIFKKDAGVVSMDDFYIVCEIGGMDDVKKILNDCELVPDVMCLYKGWLNERVKCEDLYQCLVENGLGKGSVLTTRLLELGKIMGESDYDVIDVVIGKGGVLCLDDLRIIYEIMRLSDVVKYSRIAVGHGVEMEVDLLLLFEHEAYYDNLVELYDLFFVELKLIPDNDFCNRVLEIDCVDLYDYLVEKGLFVYGEVSLEKACVGGNVYLVKTLVNMKYRMSDKDFNNLFDSGGWKVGESLENLEFYVNFGGLKVTYKIVEKLFVNKIFLENLDGYGLRYDDNIYFLYYRYDKYRESDLKLKENGLFKKYYVKMVESIGDLIEFRNVFDKFNVSLGEIKESMVKFGRVPDQYCYEYALRHSRNRKNGIIDWLEGEYGFKPTIMVLKYFENGIESYDLKFVGKYFGDNKMAHHPSNGDWEKLFIVCEK
ncbi:MAG: hypothetical protein Hyperionvirus22_12 [Hyperionvirus sp.]|uniref:Uncharacterized protein n=1 Tax=Hyperionvirus sp. TaxID=2487770 RepID=A0A3G5ADG8_9VIRU|nr:MAG: hypothetical protein Hyperionvirus22_12 [Hyperionvirus sp.]